MHMNLCNAPDDALCRGAHIMVHNGAYGHGAHVMVHMRCCTWYGAVHDALQDNSVRPV